MKTKLDNFTSFVKDERNFERSKRIVYKVRGFWPSDSVCVTQYRNTGSMEWDAPEINWSSGGRDSKLEPDDFLAAECFALAILDAVAVAREMAGETENPQTRI